MGYSTCFFRKISYFLEMAITKIVVGISSNFLHSIRMSICISITSSLSIDVIHEASGCGINTHLVRDAGRTQIAPGSETVLCVGPGQFN